MKIAFNTLPLATEHKNRGIGYYTKNLLRELEADNSLDIVKFTDNKELNRDIKLVHYPWFDLFFRSLPLLSKLPTIVSIHDVMPLLFPQNYPVGIKGRINNFLQKIALNRCSYVITDSECSKKDIIKFLKIEKDKIAVIPLAAGEEFGILKDTQLIHIKRKYNLPDHFLLYVGDANWVKNLPFLIQGFKELISIPKFQNYKLVLVGGVFLKNVENIDHPELASLKQANRLIKENGLEKLIVRPGQLNTQELIAFYNLATVYIQPSFYEGFGLTVLEAMSCGAPVLCSNTASLPEVGGRAAIYFDPKSLDRFVKILSEVLENKSLQYKLSKLGLEQSKKFSWKQTAEKTKEVYIKAINL